MDLKRRFGQLLREAVESESLAADFEGRVAALMVAMIDVHSRVDPEVDRAWHFLQHYICDADIRGRDAEYAEHQQQALRKLATKFSDGI